MFRSLFLATTLSLSAAAFAQHDVDVAGSTAPANEVFSRLHRGNRVLIDLAQDARERSSSPEVRRLAGEVLRNHASRDRSLVEFARTHRIDVDIGARGTGNLIEADRDMNADVKRLRNASGEKLDREFARTVLELDRDLVRVAEDGSRDAASGSIKNHLDDEVSFLRGEMGEADRIVRERR